MFTCYVIALYSVTFLYCHNKYILQVCVLSLHLLQNVNLYIIFIPMHDLHVFRSLEIGVPLCVCEYSRFHTLSLTIDDLLVCFGKFYGSLQQSQSVSLHKQIITRKNYLVQQQRMFTYVMHNGIHTKRTLWFNIITSVSRYVRLIVGWLWSLWLIIWVNYDWLSCV